MRVVQPDRYLIIVLVALILSFAASAGYTTWAISSHSQQACTELHILASGKGAKTPYDQSIKEQYTALWRLRCT